MRKILLTLLTACGSVKATVDTGEPADGAQDITRTSLALDLGALTGEGTVVVTPAPGERSVTLDVRGLTLGEVSVNGEPADVLVADGLAKIPVPGDAPASVGLAWTFPERSEETFDGWMPDLGVSFIWPDYCSNLFPCDPATTDGVIFEMSVTGYDAALTAIYPESTVSDAPSYMPAVALGEYTQLELGTTPAGTTLYAWYLGGEEGLPDAEFGTAHLLDVFSFYEQTYGPYAFGASAGTVEVDWGRDSTGGMEHHPYFHVGKDDFWNEEAQAHEAAHGWFGDSVRLACWEDFVLSEGTVTYMAAHALEEVGGPSVWSSYVNDYLSPICEGDWVNAMVLPETCNEIDFENDNLWSLATYMKGACFYEDVSELIGADTLDAEIAAFYDDYRGEPAEMEDMLARLREAAGPEREAAFDTLVTEWLKTLACPEDYATRCGAHDTGGG